MTFRHVTVSAPSKVILHGEHAVVYGKTAVAAALDLRTRMTIKPHKELVVVNFPDLGISQSWTLDQLRKLFSSKPSAELQGEVDMPYLDRLHDFLGTSQSNLSMASVICFLYLYSIIMEDVLVPMEIQVESEIPLGAGLGSSAALSVCLSAGLTGVLHQVKSLEKNIFNHLEQAMRKEICKLAYLSEKILHGTPSGIDNSVSTYGGLLHFTSGVLTTIPCSSNTAFNILLVNTRVERNTKDLVAKVKAKYEKYPNIVGPVLESIHCVSQQFLTTLNSAEAQLDVAQLDDLIDLNQGLLETLGVSHSSLRRIIDIFAQFGLHGKLTGAGGGGFAFALVPSTMGENTLEKARERLEAEGFTVVRTKVGGGGVEVSLDEE